MIELKDVSKAYRLFRKGRWRVLDALGFRVPTQSYEELWALRDITLTVPRGQRLGIIGRNGAGKSTLVKIVAGLAKPTTGTVRVAGQVQTLMELGTAFHPEFTGRENVLAALGYQGVTGADARARLEEIIEFSELGEFIDRPIKGYSAGMQARLAFSAATAMFPDILVIDEVLSAGDAYFAGKCRARLRELTQRSGTTVLVVSHELNSVQALCDRVLWVNGGRVARDGDPMEVCKAYYHEVQVEENRRLAGRRPGPVGALAPPDGDRTEAARGTASPRERPRTLRVFFETPASEPADAPLIAGLRLCNQEGRPVAHWAPTQSGSDRVALVEAQAWADASLAEGRVCRALRTNRGRARAGVRLTLSEPGEVSLSSHRLVVGAFPGVQAGVEVLLEQEGALLRIGQILPEAEPRWREYAFHLAVLENARPAAADLAAGRYPKSMITWRVPDPRITTVRFLDASGRVIVGIPEGQDLVVEVAYASTRRVAQPVFGMSIYLPDGRPFCRTVNTLAGAPIEAIEGRGAVRFVFSPFLGGPGEYVVSASIFEHVDLQTNGPSVFYDAHDRAYRFRVWKELGLAADMGLVRAPYRVEHLVGR